MAAAVALAEGSELHPQVVGDALDRTMALYSNAGDDEAARAGEGLHALAHCCWGSCWGWGRSGSCSGWPQPGCAGRWQCWVIRRSGMAVARGWAEDSICVLQRRFSTPANRPAPSPTPPLAP